MATAKKATKTAPVVTEVEAPKPSVTDITSKLKQALNPTPVVADVNAAAPSKVFASKSNWTGKLIVAPTFVFGVKTFKAIEDAAETFKSNMIHQCNADETAKDPKVAATYGQLKQGSMHCEACAAEVDRKASLKGMKQEDGSFIIISEDEKKSCMVQSDKEMEITKLVPATEIDPIYFAAHEYLGPDKGCEKQLQILHEMLTSTNQVAVANVAQRGREETVVIRPLGSNLVVEYLYFEHEVRGFDKFTPVTLSAEEKDLAKMLADALTDKFDSSEYKDTFSVNFRNLIAAKKAGQAAPVVAKKPEATVTTDLMAALKASLNSSKAKKAAKSAK